MPTTLAGLLIFTALVLPGFAFITTYSLDRPRRRLSTLEATAAIVVASLLAELPVAGVYSLARLPADAAPTVDTLVRQPGDHWVWLVALLAASSGLAAAAAGLLRWRRPVHPSVMSSWWVLFDHWDAAATKYVQCVLDDGSGVTGVLDKKHGSWNTEGDESADRDLILAAPITYRPPGGHEYVPHRVGAVCVSARRIVAMFVGYSDVSPDSAEAKPALAESEVAPAAVPSAAPRPVADHAAPAQEPDSSQ